MNSTLIFLLTGVLSAFVAWGQTQDATITVEADHVLHPVSRYLTGACIEDVNHEVYGGIYSQMIFGESFQEPPAKGVAGGVSGMWSASDTVSAEGRCSLETSNPFVGKQSQRITFTSGAGQIGIANRGLNRWGLSYVEGKPYEGCLDVRADAPTDLWVALESADGSKVYAEGSLSVTSNSWQHIDFILTPAASDRNGRFSIKLKQPGSIVVGYAFLQPGQWGRFHGLPVRKDVAEGLVNQGITVLRYGGSMVNAAGYRWKNMIGPPDRRPPYVGNWYPYSSDGWGIPDFLNFCEAAGFLGIPDLNVNETPQDMADFIQYVNGPTNSVWGARRLADGHPQPYGLKYMELGNEERVDASYFRKFQPLAEAIWAEDANITIVVGDFAYSQIITNPFNFSGADSGITSLAAHQQILQLAKQHDRNVWFDVHVWTDGPTPGSSLAGMFSYDDALGQIAAGSNFKTVVFELNAGNHSQRRALANALAVNAVERDGRLPIVTSANCLQPDGQNDNGWDQGLLFLNPSQIRLQPPGYVTQIISRNYEPFLIKSQVESSDNSLQVSATRSENGKTVVLSVVNPGENVASASIIIHGYSLTQSVADVEELAGPLNATNAEKGPSQIQPIRKQWQPRFENGATKYDFQPYSFTVIKFK
jgi:Alpha-L-arabinofuranosidase C-terminal domain